jgi:DNA-binding beta-propeller fold protein YncE
MWFTFNVSSRRRFAPLLACSLLFALAACGGPEQAPGADAFPNRRARYEANGHRLGYVANRFSDDVSVIDLDTMVELGRPSVGRDPVDIDGPRHVTIDRERGLAYVVLSYPLSWKGPHVTTRGDESGRSGYVVAFSLLDFTPLGELRLQQSPSDLTLSADGQALAVSHFDQARASRTDGMLEERRAALALIQPAFGLAGGGAPARFVTVCVAPSGIAYDAAGARAYVACTGEDALAVVDTRAASVVARVPAGALVANKPFGVTPDPERVRLLVSNQVASSVVVFAMNDAPVPIATAFVSGIPFGASFLDEARFVVALQDPDGVAVIDAASGTTLLERKYTADECSRPSDAKSVDASTVYLVCEGDHYSEGRVVRLEVSPP